MPPRNYIDFKLYLTAASDGKGACQVALLPTPEVVGNSASDGALAGCDGSFLRHLAERASACR